MPGTPPALTEVEWADFRRWCRALALPAEAALRIPLGRYRALLLDWTERANLTRVRDPRAVLIKHFLDSLAVLPHVAPDGPLLDIGTGAGFPGLVLKVARPALPVTLVEARSRKVAFLEEVRRQLRLEGCTVLHRFLREGDPELAGRFGSVVSRAFAAPAPFLALARGFLRPAGRVITMLGPGGAGEEDPCALAREAGASRARLHSFELPEANGERRLLVAEWPGGDCST